MARHSLVVHGVSPVIPAGRAAKGELPVQAPAGSCGVENPVENPLAVTQGAERGCTDAVGGGVYKQQQGLCGGLVTYRHQAP
jgi:hypothetical protein